MIKKEEGITRNLREHFRVNSLVNCDVDEKVLLILLFHSFSVFNIKNTT